MEPVECVVRGQLLGVLVQGGYAKTTHFQRAVQLRELAVELKQDDMGIAIVQATRRFDRIGHFDVEARNGQSHQRVKSFLF
jgi:hypothetical protein